MKLQSVKCKALSRIKDIALSDSYVIGCSGKRAVILDHRLELLDTVEQLDYVYSARMSPDEQKLLLISTGNRFYLRDIAARQTTPVTVKAPYNHNLEGRGCWSFDGTALYIPVTHSQTLHSALRRYAADAPNQYEDFLAGEYQLIDIQRLDRRQIYVLIGKRMSDRNVCFIYYDGSTFTAYPLADTGTTVVFSSYPDESTGNITLFTSRGYCTYTAEGTLLQVHGHPYAVPTEVSFSEVFETHFGADSPEMEHIRRICEAGGLEHVPVPDRIQQIEPSPDGRYIYLASQSGFYLMDAGSRALLARVPEEYGVQKITQLAPDLLALTTWHGVRLYRIVEEKKKK